MANPNGYFRQMPQLLGIWNVLELITFSGMLLIAFGCKMLQRTLCAAHALLTLAGLVYPLEPYKTSLDMPVLANFRNI